MKKMYIYEPAMCCDTGLCGVSVDPELLRLSTVINTLKKHDIKIQRYNLNNFPMEFVENETVNKMINEKGVEILPITIVDNEVVKTQVYPTNEEIISLLEIPSVYIGENKVKLHNKKNSCNCKGGCC